MIDPKQSPAVGEQAGRLLPPERRNGSKSLKLFVNEPTMRTLFALGPAAEIRFYETVAEGRQDVSTSCSKSTP